MAKKAKKKAPAKKTSAKKTPAKKAPAKKPARAASKPAASTPTSLRTSTARDRSIGLVKFAHGMMNSYAEGITEQQGTAQPEGIRNHAVWILGHMAVSNDWFAQMVDGKKSQLPEAWQPLFNKTTPTSDASAYPKLSEVKAAFDKSLERVTDAARSFTDAELNRPCTADTGGFLTDRMDSLLKTAWHYGWHQGQFATLRRALGLKAL